MNWLGELLKMVKGQEAVDFTFVERLADPGLGIAGAQLVPDECYVELYIESLRLKQARRFGTQFHGLVYSFTRLSQQGAEDAQLAAVSKPDKLADLDGSNLDRVITVSNRMMGAVPWRGGSLGLELGLFSIKKGNLLSPLLNYVARVSEVGGISFIGQVKPFLPLITEGMDLIAGQTGDSVIEVAIDTDMRLDVSCICAIIAVPKGSIDRTKLSLDPTDRKLLFEGSPLEEAYCVFSIQKTDKKPDFGAIPELKDAWAELRTAIKANDKERAEAALASFRRTAIISPDLISADATRLVGMAEQQVRVAFQGGFAPAGRKGGEGKDIGPMQALPLYQ